MIQEVVLDIHKKVKKLLIQQAKTAVRQYQWSSRYEATRDDFYELLPTDWPLEQKDEFLEYWQRCELILKIEGKTIFFNPEWFPIKFKELHYDHGLGAIH